MHPSAHPLQFHPVAPWLVAALLAGCGSLPSTTSTGSAGSSANPESSVTEVTGAPGVGGFLWQEYNSLVYEHIILSILTIGLVGFMLDRLMFTIQELVSFGDKR